MKQKLINNKKGSFGGWMEIIVLSMLFVVLLSFVLLSMNSDYGKDFDIGLDTSSLNSTFQSWTINAQDQVEGGTVERSNDGLSLLSSWSMVKGIFNLLWDVISGSWIRNLVIMMHLPIIVAVALQILFFASLIFAIVKLFFKVNA